MENQTNPVALSEIGKATKVFAKASADIQKVFTSIDAFTEEAEMLTEEELADEKKVA